MIRWMGKVLGTARTFCYTPIRRPNDRIGFVHARTPQEVIEELYRFPTHDVHLQAFSLRAIARCTRSSKSQLSDPRYQQIQRDVLTSLESLNTRSITDLIFWLRMTQTYTSRNVLPFTDDHKSRLRTRLQALMNESYFSNKQLSDLLLDAGLIGLKDTIFIESQIIDRLKNTNELFNFMDLVAILSFMSLRKLKVSRALLEAVTSRFVTMPSDDPIHEISAFRVVRQTMLSFSWFRLLELHQHIRDRVLTLEPTITAPEVKAIVNAYANNPRSDFGLEAMVERVVLHRWEGGVSLEELTDQVQYFMVLANLHREKVGDRVVPGLVSKLETVTIPGDVPLIVYERLLYSLNINHTALPKEVIQKFDRIIADFPPSEALSRLSLSKLKAASGLTDDLSSLAHIPKLLRNNQSPLSVKSTVKMLQTALTHPSYPHPTLQAVIDAVFDNCRELEKIEKAYYWVTALNDILWKGSAKVTDFNGEKTRILEVIDRNFGKTSRLLTLDALRWFVLTDYSSVKLIITNNSQKVTPEEVEIWIRACDFTSEFDSFVAMLTIFQSKAPLKSLINVFRFHHPLDSSESVLSLLSLIRNQPGALLSNSIFHFHSDLLLKIMQKYPFSTEFLQHRLAKELNAVQPSYFAEEITLKTAIALKALGHPTAPVQDLKQLLSTGSDSALFYILELFPDGKEVKAYLETTQLENFVGLIPKQMDKYRLKHKFNGFLTPAMNSQQFIVSTLISDFQERVLVSPLKTGVEFLREISTIDDPRLSTVKLVAFTSLFNRLMKQTVPEIDVIIDILPVFRHLPIGKRIEAEDLVGILTEKWGCLGLREKMQAVIGLTDMGYTAKTLFEQVIPAVTETETTLMTYAPDLIRCLHTVNVHRLQGIGELYGKYFSVELGGTGKRLNSIDFAKVGIAAMNSSNVSKEHYQALKEMFPDCMHDMELLRKYILALGQRCVGHLGREAKVIGELISGPVQTELAEALKANSVDQTGNYVSSQGAVLPIFVHKSQTVLWNPRSTHMLWYSGSLNGDLQVYEDLLKARHRTLRVPQGFQSIQEAEDWLKGKRIIE